MKTVTGWFKRFLTAMAAVAFAEENLPEEALRLLAKEEKEHQVTIGRPCRPAAATV